MMGFNSTGHGGTSSSSASSFSDRPLCERYSDLVYLAEFGKSRSNLPSLASPLPINPPVPHFTHGHSYPSSFKPPDHSWPHLHPPPSVSNSAHTPNSTHPTSLASTSSYRQPTSSFSGNHSLSRTYSPHYPPPAIPPGNSYPVAVSRPLSSSSFDLSQRSLQNDYTQIVSGLEFTAVRGDFRNGMSDGKYGRWKANDGSGLNRDYGLAAIQHHLSGIGPLDESNYTKWKSQIDIILGHLDCDMALLEPKPNEPKDTSPESVKAKYQKWIKANHICILIIRNSIPESIASGLPETDSAKELMDFIQTQFSGSTRPLISALISKLCTVKFNGQGSVCEHINKMENLVYKLKDLNMVLPDEFLVHLAINSLPSVFHSLKVKFNSTVEKWSLSELIDQCVQEEAILRQRKVVSSPLKTLKPKKKDLKKSKKKKLKVGQHLEKRGVQVKEGKSRNLHDENIVGAQPEDDRVCFFCHKSGHWKRNCELWISMVLKTRNGGQQSMPQNEKEMQRCNSDMSLDSS